MQQRGINVAWKLHTGHLVTCGCFVASLPSLVGFKAFIQGGLAEAHHDSSVSCETSIKATVTGDVSIPAVFLGPSSLKPLLHLSPSRCPSLASHSLCLAAVYLRTCTNSIRPKMIQQAAGRGCARRVFTSGARILQVRGSGGGHVLRVGARQQRRALVHAVGGHAGSREKRRAEAPGFHRVFAQHRGAACGWLSVLRCSGPATLMTAARGGGARRWSPPPSPLLPWACADLAYCLRPPRTQWWNFNCKVSKLREYILYYMR